MAFTFDMYKAKLGTSVPGRARKMDSDLIMDATFKEDIQYQVAYFFDYYHTTAENRLKLEGFNPNEDLNAVPIEIKFIAHSKKTYEKDEVTMHIQFRPGHTCAVDYYPEMFGNRYNAQYPIGLYVWIRGEDEVYRRWLVVATADAHENQFPTYEVLRCNDIYRWVKDGKFYEFPGVSRSQNSYNSGLWLDFKIQSPEDQTKFCLPLNRDTEHLFYNTRLIIDAPVLTEPRAWLISKINRAVSKGVVVFTTTQDTFNQFTDQAFYKENGDVDYWVADWNKSAVPPTSEEPSSELFTSITSRITSPGTAQIRVGGSKTLTIIYYEDDVPVDHEVGEWTFFINGEDATPLLSVTFPSANKIKIKFTGGDEYIGSILTIINTTVDEIISSIDVEVIAF